MSFQIRRARPGDAAAIHQLEQEARAALGDARGGPQLLAEQPPVSAWVDVISDATRAVWVATIDDVVVGYLELQLPPVDGAGIVRQVHVHPGARELGFGDWMLEAAIAEIVAGGGTVVESFALPGDRDTKNLFERAGVTARKIIVSKRLVQPPT